jgi:hypothetical protein
LTLSLSCRQHSILTDALRFAVLGVGYGIAKPSEHLSTAHVERLYRRIEKMRYGEDAQTIKLDLDQDEGRFLHEALQYLRKEYAEDLKSVISGGDGGFDDVLSALRGFNF